MSIFEIKILFGYYIDIFNFGVLFKSDLKSKLDDIIKIKDAIYNYSTEMNKVWSNPLTALEESKYELGNKIYKVFYKFYSSKNSWRWICNHNWLFRW